MQCICVRSDVAFIGVVGKLSCSIVICSAFVLGVDVQVTRSDESVIGVVGKLSCRIVLCTAFLQV